MISKEDQEVNEYVFAESLYRSHDKASRGYRKWDYCLIGFSIFIPLALGIASFFIDDSMLKQANTIKSIGIMLVSVIGLTQGAFIYSDKKNLNLRFAIKYSDFALVMSRNFRNQVPKGLINDFEAAFALSIPILPKRLRNEMNLKRVKYLTYKRTCEDKTELNFKSSMIRANSQPLVVLQNRPSARLDQFIRQQSPSYIGNQDLENVKNKKEKTLVSRL